MNASSDAPTLRKIRVLIADDSAFVRALLQTILDAEPRIEVIGTARNGKEALATFVRLKPDLVLLDVEMPEMDGLEALSLIRRLERLTPVIMCSTLTQRGVQTTLEALARGATDYIAKRGGQSSLSQGVPSLEQELVPKILSLFPDKPSTWIRQAAITSGPLSLCSPVPEPELIVIGVSTGGPAALEVLLPQIPANFPLPILVVQHMPQRFTAQLASRLNSLCLLRVCEATNGNRPQPGVVNIARGDWHLELTRDFRLHLHQREVQNFCRPSVDLLFQSACMASGGHLLGLILTGMGSDGLEGCRAIRNAGGAVFAQDNNSSIVWGMPGSVVHAGLANKVLGLNDMAAEVVRFASNAVSEKRITGVVA
jgi:two-component system, chemotaxis family, protein-glutamate methylesterase/glutaminase